MILVDTSIWVSHLSRGLPALAGELDLNNVLTHPFVIGELSLGNLVHRTETLELLANLPLADAADGDEVMALIETEGLYAKKIGWVDAHLIASVRLTECSLWTLDQSVLKVAKSLRIPAYR